MNVILEQLHSFFAYAFLLSTLISVGYAVVNLFQKDKYSNTQLGLARFSCMLAHLQLLIGILSWIQMGFFQLLQTNAKEIMTNPLSRLIAIEHPLVNIIGIILITIGYSSIKKAQTDVSKQKINLIFYGIGLVLILSRLPWHLWLN
jgi:hypothetical protein